MHSFVEKVLFFLFFIIIGTSLAALISLAVTLTITCKVSSTPASKNKLIVHSHYSYLCEAGLTFHVDYLFTLKK